MSRITSVASDTSQAARTQSDLQNVDVDEFLKLLIAELQNQDPLDPLDNNEMLQQISQIREIGATDRLTSTLNALFNGQNLTTGSSMIGKTIRALTDDGQEVEGIVDRVSIEAASESSEQRILRIHIGQTSIPLSNVREIVAKPSISGDSIVNNT